MQPLTTAAALLEIVTDTNTSTLSIKNNQAEWNFSNLVSGHLELNDGAGGNVLTFDKDTRYVGIGVTGLPSEQLQVGGNLKVNGEFKLLDNTDGKFLVAKNGSYRPVTLTGDMTLNRDGEITYNNNSINNSKLENETIMNNKISPNADISMSKTNFTPSNQFVYNGVNGSLNIKDLYVMKNTEGGSSDINDLTTTGDYTRLTDSKIGDYKGDGDGIYMNWYKERNDNISYQQGFLGATDDVVSFKNLEQGNKFTFNGPVGIGIKQANTALDISGSITINGINTYIKFDDSGAGDLLIGNGTYFKPTQQDRLSNITISKDGLISIKANQITNEMVSDDQADKIDLKKIDFNYDPVKFTMDTSTNRLGLTNIFVRNDQNNTFDYDLTVQGQINSNSAFNVVGDGMVASYKGWRNGCFFRMFRDKNQTEFATVGFSSTTGAEAKEFKFVNNELGNQFTFNGPITMDGKLKGLTELQFDERINPRSNRRGYILVADGDKFRPVEVKGDITMDGNGGVEVIRTSIKGLSLGKGAIYDININEYARIQMRKTNFNVDKNQFIYEKNVGLKKSDKDLLQLRESVLKKNIVQSLTKFCDLSDEGFSSDDLIRMRGLRSLTAKHFPGNRFVELGICLEEMLKRKDESAQTLQTAKKSRG